MAKDFQWVKTEIDVTEREDGDLIIRNKVPLADYPANLGIWLHRNARKLPEKFFLKQRNGEGEWASLTYAETLTIVNRISNGLVAMGLEAGRPVAVLSENSINMALIQMAAMQVGLPVVPISFAYSVRSQTGLHIKHILGVTNASVLVMSDADLHMPKINQWDLGDLQLFAFTNSEKHDSVRPFEDLFAGESTLSSDAGGRFSAVTPDTLAKIQFTSGSTNLPKGVMVTHGMQVTNQVGIHQMWSFLDSRDVIVDWLPWNHTFGGNFVFNMMLMHGGTFFIDNGNPTPAGLPNTINNIKDVSPTLYFGVPRSYNAIYARMREDEALKHAFFKNLKFIFTAAAALDQTTFEGIKQMSAEVRGETVPFFSAWGSTETAPDATLIYWEIDDARVIGLPIPGVSIKLASDPSGKMELRVKGPNVTRGYYNNPDATAEAFDNENYYCSQDAGKFLDPDRPDSGLIFDGRTSEDFKLSSGTWVYNSAIRNSINNLGQPFMLEVVIVAPSRDYLTAMVFPNVPVLRGKFKEVGEIHSEDTKFLQDNAVVSFFQDIFKRHNTTHSGNNARIERFTLLVEPPLIDKNETTDKGYINQSAVLSNRTDIVDTLYSDPPPDGVIMVEVA